MENFLWQTFETSGDINLYLAFKSIQDISHKNILSNVKQAQQLTSVTNCPADMTL